MCDKLNKINDVKLNKINDVKLSEISFFTVRWVIYIPFTCCKISVTPCTMQKYFVPRAKKVPASIPTGDLEPMTLTLIQTLLGYNGP